MATTNRRPLNFKNPFPQPAGVMFEGRLYQPTMLRIITAFYYILAWLSVIQKVVTGPTIVAWGHVLGMPVATAVFWYSTNTLIATINGHAMCCSLVTV